MMSFTRVIQAEPKSDSHTVKTLNDSFRGLSKNGRRNIGQRSHRSTKELESVFEATMKDTGKRRPMKIQDKGE